MPFPHVRLGLPFDKLLNTTVAAVAPMMSGRILAADTLAWSSAGFAHMSANIAALGDIYGLSPTDIFIIQNSSQLTL